MLNPNDETRDPHEVGRLRYTSMPILAIEVTGLSVVVHFDEREHAVEFADALAKFSKINTEVSPHKFSPLRFWDRWHSGGRCRACMRPKWLHPVRHWTMARAIGDTSAASVPGCEAYDASPPAALTPPSGGTTKD